MISSFVRGEGVYLRPPEMRDYEAWAELRETSRAFLTPWEPTWPGDDLTPHAFRRTAAPPCRRKSTNDEAYPFLIFRDGDDTLVGGLTLGQVKRGVAQSATLGYWMGAPYAGKGLMSRAVRAMTGFAFTSLRLHRIEAACLPHNAASVRLLERVGFKREGFARAYLRINGLWQDHLLYALLETDPLPLRVVRPRRVAEWRNNVAGFTHMRILVRRLCRHLLRLSRCLMLEIAPAARHRIRPCSARCASDRSDQSRRTLQFAGRPPAGLDRARLRRHRPAHRSPRARTRHASELDRFRADQ